jgi:hypothetical protein
MLKGVQTDVTKLLVAFCNFAKASETFNTSSVYCILMQLSNQTLSKSVVSSQAASYVAHYDLTILLLYPRAKGLHLLLKTG